MALRASTAWGRPLLCPSLQQLCSTASRSQLASCSARPRCPSISMFTTSRPFCTPEEPLQGHSRATLLPHTQSLPCAHKPPARPARPSPCRLPPPSAALHTLPLPRHPLHGAQGSRDGAQQVGRALAGGRADAGKDLPHHLRVAAVPGRGLPTGTSRLSVRSSHQHLQGLRGQREGSGTSSTAGAAQPGPSSWMFEF